MAAAAPPPRSPFKADLRKLRENLRATTKYSMEKTCNPRFLADRYIEGLKTSYGLASWDSIADDPDVRTAIHNVATMGYSHSDAFYHAVSYMLNRISFAYLQSKGVSMDAVDSLVLVFSAPTNSAVLGDYLGVAAKADLLAFMDTPAALKAALQATSENRYVVIPDWVHVLGVGEWKDGSGRTGQFLWYLVALKRYRPDLATAYGLLIENGKVSITGLNPCGSWMSKAVPIAYPRERKRDDGHAIPAAAAATIPAAAATIPSAATIPAVDSIPTADSIPGADTWIAYVILLYQAHAGRDDRFRSITGATDGFARWNIDLQTHAPLVRPFHATYGPGRMSWFSFELDESATVPPSAPLAKGFVKVSWQDTKANFNEASLLEVAHRDTWLPGLVRHWTAVRDDPNKKLVTRWGQSPSGNSIARVKEIVYLASIGQPLSQCSSVLHLLEVVYDAVQVHYEMLKRGVIHGDMSWFNILCNPWHDPKTEDNGKLVADDVPCIQYILTGNKTSRPRALVLDLDHGALTDVLYAPGYKGRKEKSGTPMFVSIELSSKTPLEITTMDPGFLAAELGRAEVEPELFARAFPNGAGSFMEDFRRVAALERERSHKGESAYTNPNEPHHPHHDMESIYWILTWAFSRACPAGFDPHGKLDDDLSKFANLMLDHRLDDEEFRFEKLYGSARVRKEVLHPELQRFHPLIRNIALYLAIPWNRYMHIMQPDHAHVAIRRFMLPWIHELAIGKYNNVAFDTTQPRTIRVTGAEVRDRMSPVERHTPSAAPATQGSRRRTQPVSEGFAPLVAPDDMPVQPSTADSATADGASPSEVLGGSDSVGFNASAPETRGSKRRADSQNDSDPPKPKRTKKPVDPPAPATPRHERDVDALIDMFWADRTLWFGNGFRNVRDFRSAERAEGAQQA